MTNWLIKKFITNKYGEDERRKRLYSGILSGIVGIILNVILGMVKVIIGTFSNSVAITADAVNNLSDAASSVITLVGFSLANKKSDAEHPFGHARIEYMTGVIVSALVMVVGVMLITSSWGEIKNPTPINANTIMFVLLILATLVKLWLYVFNKQLSKLINSSSLMATSIDSRNDAIISLSTIAVILLFEIFGVNIDGFVGVAVGIFIIFSGLNMVRENAGPLLGESPDPETVRDIGKLVLGHKGVLGIHDLIVHDYGPGHIFASVHVEVDSREDIFKSHALVDDIEKAVHEELGVFLVGHMDPLDTKNKKIKEISEFLEKELGRIEGVVEFHDLRIIKGKKQTKVIFDVVVSHDDPERTFKKVEKTAQEMLIKIDEKYIAVVNRDLDYNANIILEKK